MEVISAFTGQPLHEYAASLSSPVVKPEHTSNQLEHGLSGLDDSGNRSDGGINKSGTVISDEERVRRRRESNRNAQRRTRERRMKEIEALRAQVTHLLSENQLLKQRLESMSQEKGGLLSQIQDLTARWHRSLGELDELRRLQTKVLPPGMTDRSVEPGGTEKERPAAAAVSQPGAV